MAGFLNVPEKMTDPVNFKDRLGNIFASSVDEDVRKKFRESLARMNELRSDAVSGKLDGE